MTSASGTLCDTLMLGIRSQGVPEISTTCFYNRIRLTSQMFCILCSRTERSEVEFNKEFALFLDS
jgi:hypothetical protein